MVSRLPVWGLLYIGLLLQACSSTGKGLFAGKTAHERYADKINTAGLQETALGRNWFAAASRSLSQPASIRLPYRESGYFEANQPDAAGYRFTARRGDKVAIKLQRKPTQGFALFLDLWQPDANAQPRHLASADSTGADLIYSINKDGDYLLRLQPELLAGGEYTLEIRTGPSLDFPVAVSGRPRISSFWGDARDGGARSHEGVDIFSPRRTPLLAAAPGVITSVSLNKLGGKVIFLRPRDKDFALYYAHLDSQLVSAGQRVEAGDTIGLLGNTGNAITTSPHLHFGIYAQGGAIDPLPFIDTKREEPATITVATEDLAAYRRSLRNAVVYRLPDKQSARVAAPKAGTVLRTRSATGNWYKVMLPDGSHGFVAGNLVTTVTAPLRTVKADTATQLLDLPHTVAAVKGSIDRDTTIRVLGLFDDYYYVQTTDKTGWIRSASID
ncbi:peptidoglycan DD-metalloendopeptidase family protein [Paraflavitalea pollutisoli]|uniref:peptidoglycan DD-metalloendopeptidase family protein n=1 Tax=Paraflavitalea pollutisoli TaxID=3034143 RepID=UPI0023ECBB01|nr:peptidoglycan DD-metalloendopeptidase family protein [Paraflavitalea sp. H1-2-19X]